MWEVVELRMCALIAVSYTHLDVYKRQIIDNSRSVDFGEDRLRERGSLPTTFYVLTRVIVSMTNDNCRTFKQLSLIHI